MQRSIKRSSRLSRVSAATLALALVAGVTASCAPTTPTSSAPAQFCTFWDKVADAPPAPTNAVLVKDQVVALADSTTVTGSACTDPNAKVALAGAVLAKGEEVASEQGTSSTAKVAAVTGNEIAANEPVLDNLSVKTLSADIGPSGISSSPVVFSGTLTMTNGVPSLSLTASATAVKIGDIFVNSATIKLLAGSTGVSATVQGSLKIGPSTASGVVDVAFDKAGALVSAKANISAHLLGTQAGGKKIDLTGTVKLDGNANETAISFSGSGIVGDLVVNKADGSLTLATNKATFIGTLDVAQGPNYLRFDGSIVWDGVSAYTPFLTLQGGGEFTGTLNDGQAVSVAGTIDTTIVGGQVHAVVTGDFKIGTLKAKGSAIVETNGATTTLNVDADLIGAGFDAKIGGVVVITDGLAESVSLDAAVTGVVKLGDATLTGANLHIGTTYGNPLDLTFSGGLQVGSSANLSGSIAASFGPNGTLLSLNGQLSGGLQLSSWGLLDFAGSVVASPSQVTLSGSGSLRTINFPLGVTFKGSFTSSLLNPSWSLNGSGKLQIASLQIASARLNLSQGVGMRATRAGFYFSIIGIPVYFEGDFYMNPGGGCSKVNLTGGSFLARPILALVLPGVIGCPVNY